MKEKFESIPFFRPGKKVVDIGCWDNIEPSMTLASKGVSVFAVDRYQKMTQFKEKLLDSIKNKKISEEISRKIIPLKADAVNLPFPEGFIDGILFLYSVSWLEQFGTEPLMAYREATRVLKGDGIVIITESNTERAKTQEKFLNTMMKSERKDNIVIGRKFDPEEKLF
ncbi:MAG: methyltransferase domain-containing protein [candidate division WOR-3 bacterium]